MLFQKQGNGTGNIWSGHTGAALYGVTAALAVAACDGSPRSYNIRLTDAGTGRSPAGVVGHAAAHDIDYTVVIGTAHRDDFAADTRRGDGSSLWSHVPGCHNHYKACIPDFFDTAHQGRSLTHVPAGKRADGYIDNADVEAVTLLQDNVETGQDIGNVAAAPFVQHLDRNEVAAGSNAAEPAFAGTAVSGDDAADMSAVSVIIIRQPSPPYHIKKGGDPCLIVFVGKTAGIQYGYPDAAPGGVVRTGSGRKNGGLAHGNSRLLFTVMVFRRSTFRTCPYLRISS